MAPSERGHDRAAGTDTAVVHELDLAGVDRGAGGGESARDAVSKRRTPIAGSDAVDDDILGARREMLAEISVGKTKREPITRGEAPINRGRDGIARGVFAGVAPGVIREIGLVGRGVGEAGAEIGRDVGDRSGTAPLRGLITLRRVLHRVAGGERETEVFVHRDDRGDVEAGMNLVGFFAPAGAWSFAQKGALGVLHEERNAVVERRFVALEGAARDEIHGAGESGAGLFGCRRTVYFDARDAVDGNLVELDRARGAGTRSTRHIETADGDRDVARRHAADRETPGIAARVIARDAREKLHELAHAAVGDRAECIRGDDVGDVFCKTLLVDRDRGRVHFARSIDGKSGEFDRVVGAGFFFGGRQLASERDVTLHGLARREHHGLGERAAAGVENL